MYVLFVGKTTELFSDPAGAMLGLFHVTLGEFQVVTCHSQIDVHANVSVITGSL
jgi:hypothetical protein